jgi:hypothetical protein
MKTDGLECGVLPDFGHEMERFTCGAKWRQAGCGNNRLGIVIVKSRSLVVMTDEMNGGTDRYGSGKIYFTIAGQENSEQRNRYEQEPSVDRFAAVALEMATQRHTTPCSNYRRLYN